MSHSRLSRPLALVALCLAEISAVPAAEVGADPPPSPSLIERTGIDAFTPYDIGNVRGLDAGRVVGNYRWNGLPVLNHSRSASESAQRYDVQAGLRALETGFVYPGGVVELVTRDPRARDRALAAGYSTRSMRYAAADFGGDGVRLNVAGEDGGLPVPGTAYNRAYAAVSADTRLAPGTRIEGNFEFSRFRERGEQASLYTAGLPVPAAPAATTLLGQTWAGTHGDERTMSLRLRQQLDNGWEALVGALRFEDRYDDSDFYGDLLPGGNYTLNYARDPSQRFVSDTLHAELRGTARTGAVTHRLAGGTTAMRSRSIIQGAATTPLGISNLYAPRPFAPITLSPANAPFEAQRATDTGLFLSDRMQLSEQIEVVAGYKGGRYRQTGANVTQPADDRYHLKSAGLVLAPGGSGAGRRTAFYASYGEALEQGITAPLGATNAERVLPSYVTRQIEVGARFAALARLELEAAAFRAKKGYDYPSATGAFVQDGQLVHEGIELKAVGEATRDLRLFASLLWLRPRVENAADPGVNGQAALGVPERGLRLIGEYDLPDAPGLSLNAALDAYSHRPADAYGATRVAGYGTFSIGAQLRRKWVGEMTTLRFEIGNVADRSYWSGVSGGYLYLSEPRSASLRLEIALR
jgi:iron complex outermembrane receptor protein